MSIVRSRRRFIQSVPLASIAAAAGFAGLQPQAFAAAAGAIEPTPFQLFKGDKLAADEKESKAKPGDNKLVTLNEFTVVLTTEEKKSAPQFEWHEHRDHIVQILDGTTLYELGGKPANSRNTRPGEWLASTSEGATSIPLTKGDMLTIPRGTPHKRSTATSVTFLLISPMGEVMTTAKMRELGTVK